MERMSLFWITLFILIFPQKGKLDLSPVNPILEICDNGVPDVVVTLTNGTHCLLKGQHLFEIDVHRENASHVFRMNEKFGDRIDGYVDLAFTMSGVSWSEANDRTIMVKGNRYFVYHNYEYVTDDYTKHWFETKKGVSPNEAFYDQVIHQKEDAVISFRHRKMLHQYETAMLFDDHRRPERVNVYRVASALHPSVLSIMDSSQAYYFVPSIGDTFHLYFQSGDEGFFCFLPAFNSRVRMTHKKEERTLSPMNAIHFSPSSNAISFSSLPLPSVVAVLTKKGYKHVSMPSGT